MTQENRPPRTIQLLFFFLPTKPKSNNIYWCIIKVKSKTSDETEYHYTYVEYSDGDFIVPANEKNEITVEAWCELIHPSLLFTKPKPAPRIIIPRSKFIPRKN